MLVNILKTDLGTLHDIRVIILVNDIFHLIQVKFLEIDRLFGLPILPPSVSSHRIAELTKTSCFSTHVQPTDTEYCLEMRL